MFHLLAMDVVSLILLGLAVFMVWSTLMLHRFHLCIEHDLRVSDARAHTDGICPLTVSR